MRHYEIVLIIHPDQSEQVPAMLAAVQGTDHRQERQDPPHRRLGPSPVGLSDRQDRQGPLHLPQHRGRPGHARGTGARLQVQRRGHPPPDRHDEEGRDRAVADDERGRQGRLEGRVRAIVSRGVTDAKIVPLPLLRRSLHPLPSSRRRRPPDGGMREPDGPLRSFPSATAFHSPRRCSSATGCATRLPDCPSSIACCITRSEISEAGQLRMVEVEAPAVAIREHRAATSGLPLSTRPTASRVLSQIAAARANGPFFISPNSSRSTDSILRPLDHGF